MRLPQPLELLRLRRFAPRDRVTTTLPGHRLVVPEPGAFLAQWNAIWERGHYAFSTTNPAPRILDCGANVGLASLYWKRTHPGARITAFEADPKIAAMLRENVAASGADDIEIVQAAVWDKNGTVSFRTGSPDASHITSGGEASVEVASVRLREYLAEPVDLLKLDIEGAEVTVLADCATALERVARVFVEFHSFADRPQRLDELTGVLSRAGYRLYIESDLDLSARPFERIETYVGMDLLLNIYASRETRTA